MSLPNPISAPQTVAKAPIDQLLMDSIRIDLDDLDSRLAATKSFDYSFKVNGNLNWLPGVPGGINNNKTPLGFGTGLRLDGALIAAAQTFSKCRLYLEQPGASGSLVVDIRKYNTANNPILSILRLYSDSINSINTAGATLSTQSITRSAAQIATQSISFWKTQKNVQSIVVLGANLSRINLDVAPDADYQIGDYVTIASATTGANNGTFQIVRVNDDGTPNLVITNASAVAQTGIAGTLDLQALAYNFNAPASADFSVGESQLFASHTTGANNGTFVIYARNSGGNNLVVKNQTGVVQAGVVGNVNTQRFTFTFSAAPSADYVIGEPATMSGHTSGLDNGQFIMVDVGRGGGNNVVVSIPAGVIQGGVAGSVNSNRWIYSLPSDPTTSFVVGDTCQITSATTGSNNGIFKVVQIDRASLFDLVIVNTVGVQQVGAAGTLESTKMKVAFATDPAGSYIAGVSRLEIVNCVNPFNNGYFDVTSLDFGGGANKNVVIDNAQGSAQPSPCGRVAFESRSIFSTLPSLTLATDSYDSTNRDLQFVNDAVFNAQATVTADTLIAMDVLQSPFGAPANLVVQLV